MITNFELQQRMRKVIKPNLQTLLVIALIAALPGLIVDVLTTLTATDVWSYLYAHGIDTSATTDQLSAALDGYAAEQGWVMGVLSLVRWLASPVLLLGLIHATLTLLRGGTAVVTTVFARLNAFGRSLLLDLLISVKILAWSLPGIALMFLPLWLGPDTLFICGLLSLIALLVLATMASYRYAMANIFLADDPATGVRECVRQSKTVMKERKMQLFKLEMPYLLGSVLIGSLISVLLDNAVGLTLSMAVQLVFTVYLYGARCSFFEAYSRPDGGRAHAFQSDPYHEEMKE